MRSRALAIPLLGTAALALAIVVACGSSSSDVAPAADDASATTEDARSDDGATAPDSGTSPDGAPCTTCARDWQHHPPVVQVDGASEIWALSDVHGDYQAFTKLLAAAHLIATTPSKPSAVEWTGGTAKLVIVGDLIDKGPDAVDVLRLVIALQSAAAAENGGVVVTMGNHEAEFLADPANAKAAASDGVDSQLQKAGFAAADTAVGANDLGGFLRNLPFAARVDDWFFVHGGKTDGRTVAKLNEDLQNGIDAHGFGAPVLSAGDSLLEARLEDAPPQWWDATGDAPGLLGAWTAALGVKHLVMGHQPGAVGFNDGGKRAADQMIQMYDARIFLVDTGLSVGADETGGALLHVKNVGLPTESFEEVLPTGAVKPL